MADSSVGGNGKQLRWAGSSDEQLRAMSPSHVDFAIKAMSSANQSRKFESGYQKHIREALLQVSDIENDVKISSEAKGLANNELGEYEFIVAIDMLIDVAIDEVKGLIAFFKGYRETGFLEVLETAKGIALEIDIVSSLEGALTRDGKSDIDANELFVELMFLQDFIPEENMGPIEILKFLKRHDYFPNAIIAYRVLLTIPRTVASAERSFSKLKLLKSYLRSTMTQERLNDLAMIALESDILEKIEYEFIIENFISRNTKRMMLFG
ncbi:uncharacterized protein [Setaria viridis]|uniref:uncharacterized protein n=1 Tax=Setaria viridis TaxID=4556 RepID=UPI001493C359|nr:uncharacterized protein LOC117856307 [Setaria viridis]